MDLAGAASASSLSDAEYQRILAVRDQLRRFLRWSEDEARRAGLTPAQHQLLLAIRGHPAPEAPTMKELAEHLMLQHHSVVGLVDRAESAGLVRRVSDPADKRLVRVHLEARGQEALERLTTPHLGELQRLARIADRLGPIVQQGGDRATRQGSPGRDQV